MYEFVQSNYPGSSSETAGRARSLGELITNILKDESFAELMTVSQVESSEAALQAVDDRQAGLAIILPANLSKQFIKLDGQANIDIYQDPTLTLGPAIVRSIISQFMDNLSGAKIALRVILTHRPVDDPSLIGQIMQQYMKLSSQSQEPADWVVIQNADVPENEPNPMLDMIGPIFGGMMIFYAFYTGTASAQSILREEEGGTLQRLFTTPTPQAVILTGKFLSVFLTTFIQVIVLLLLGQFIFQIDWGSLPVIGLLTIGIVLPASTFGIFVNSMTKSTKQSGVVFGAVLTMSGMIGLIRIFTLGVGENPTLRTASLFVPQGWVVDQLLQSMGGASTQKMIPIVLILIAWSVVFFTIGVWRFNKRYDY